VQVTEWEGLDLAYDKVLQSMQVLPIYGLFRTSL
jgi:hypothetical protein